MAGAQQRSKAELKAAAAMGTAATATKKGAWVCEWQPVAARWQMGMGQRACGLEKHPENAQIPCMCPFWLCCFASALPLPAAPTPLMGLSGARPALKGARLTTTLSQDGLAPAAAAAGAGPRATAASKARQQPAAAAKAGSKRALEALAPPSAAKRQKVASEAAAAAAAAAAGPSSKPATAAGGRSNRKAPAGAAAAAAAAAAGERPEDSQALSIHHLLHSAQRRHAAVSQHPSQDDRWAGVKAAMPCCYGNSCRQACGLPAQTLALPNAASPAAWGAVRHSSPAAPLLHPADPSPGALPACAPSRLPTCLLAVRMRRMTAAWTWPPCRP